MKPHGTEHHSGVVARRAPPRAEPAPESGDRPTVVRGPETIAFYPEVEEAPFVGVVVEQARALHRQNKHEDALTLVSGVLALLPTHPDAAQVAASCRAALEREHLSVIGPESAVLSVARSPHELLRTELDGVSGFLISLVDGRSSLADVVDMSGLPTHVALKLLRGLVLRGIIRSSGGGS